MQLTTSVPFFFLKKTDKTHINSGAPLCSNAAPGRERPFPLLGSRGRRPVPPAGPSHSAAEASAGEGRSAHREFSGRRAHQQSEGGEGRGEQASEALLCAVLPVPPWARASTYLLIYKTVAEKLRCAKFAQGAWEAARGSQNPERRRRAQPHAPSVDESLWETASRGRPKSSVPAGLQGADTPVPRRTLVPLSLGEGEAGV